MSTFKAAWPTEQYLRYLTGCGFTKREREIIRMTRDGDSQCQIAQALDYCDSTIDKSVRSIKNKINEFEAVGLPPS